MNIKIKLFLFMSLVACIDSGLLKAYTKAEKEALFDQHKDFHKQNMFILKLVKYLKKEGRDSEFIKKIDNKGLCFGLSFLWAYGKRLQDELITDPKKARDDYNFFNTTYRLLVTWDGKTDFSVYEKLDIDRFVSNVVLYQREGKRKDLFNTIQEDLPAIFEDTKGGKLEIGWNVKIFASSPLALTSRLKSILGFLGPKCIIMIGINGVHEAALYKDKNNRVEFYEPNDKRGEVVIHSSRELAENVWAASDCIMASDATYCDKVNRTFDVSLYRFADDIEYPFPTEKDELTYRRSTPKELIFLINTADDFILFIKNDCFHLLEEKNNDKFVEFLFLMSPVVISEVFNKTDSYSEFVLDDKNKKIILNSLATMLLNTILFSSDSERFDTFVSSLSPNIILQLFNQDTLDRVVKKEMVKVLMKNIEKIFYQNEGGCDKDTLVALVDFLKNNAHELINQLKDDEVIEEDDVVLLNDFELFYYISSLLPDPLLQLLPKDEVARNEIIKNILRNFQKYYEKIGYKNESDYKKLMNYCRAEQERLGIKNK